MIRILPCLFCLAQLTIAQGFDTTDIEHLRSAYQQHMLHELVFDSSPPQADSSLDYLGQWGWGKCRGVAVMGNYVFTGSGPTVLWLDVTDRRNPVIVWETQTNGVSGNFIIRDSIGFALLAGQTLLIVDFRNPLAPVVSAELPITPGLLSLAIADSLAFAKRYLGFIYCINVSNPSSPYLRAIIRETTTQWGTLAISNGSLYVGDQNGFTEHIDVSNPDSARATILYNVVPLVIAAYAKDTLLFLGGYGSRLFIYSTKIPAAPIQLSNLIIGNVAGITSITVQGDTAFAGTVEGRVVAINISDKRNPVILGTYTPPVLQPELSAGALAAQDTVLYGSFWNGLKTFSIANPAAMNVLSFFPTGYVSSKVVVKNGLAYVTSGYAGLWVVDISNPTHPTRLGNLQTPGYAYDLVVDSTVAYLSLNHPAYNLNEDAPNGVLTLDISQPDSMRVLDSCTIDSPFANAKSGSLLFVAQANDTLTILDVRDPSNLRLISKTPVGNVREIAARDSIAFVANASGFGSPHPGLNIIDCRNPTSPQLLSTTLRSAQGVSINGQLAYVHRGDSTYVLDITNLAGPVILGRVRHPPPGYGGAWESIAATNTVFWANAGEFGLIDVASPSEPRVLFEIGSSWEGGIAVVKDTIYVTGANGVWIYKYNRGPTFVSEPTNAIPHGLHLFPNYPNPFNAVTQLKFSTAVREEIHVDVYNVLGQRVRRAFTGIVDAGEHTIEFDASSLPSGTYFCRLQSPTTVKIGRMMLIK